MSKPEAYLQYLSTADILGIETALAAVVAIAVTIGLFFVLRRWPPAQRIVLPGLGFANEARSVALGVLAKLAERAELDGFKLTDAEAELVGRVAIATAIRLAATVLAVALIFAAVLSAIAPLVM